MFYSHQLLARKAPLGQIWMAATLHAKINRRKLDKLDLVKICEEILNPTVPMALRLSGILMGGVVIVYERKVKLLLDDVSRLLVEINEAWKVKQVKDPTVLPKGKNQAKYDKVTMAKNHDPVTMDYTAAEIEQSLNFSNNNTNMNDAGYFTMRLDRIDEPFTNEESARDPEDQKHHQADMDHITLFDPSDTNQPVQNLFNRFERFDIEGDEDMNANFTSHEHSQIPPTLIPSPPPQEIPQPGPVEPDNDMRDEHPEPHNNQQADERRDDVQQVQEDDVKPVIIKGNRRRKRTTELVMDFEPIIGGAVYQSWLHDTSDLVGRKERAKSVTRMKIAQLMDVPPVALVCGLAGKHSTKIYYPKPLLELYRRSIQIGRPRDSPSGSTSAPQPPEPVSPLANEGADGNPEEVIGVRTRSKQPSAEKQKRNHPGPVEDFQSGVGSHSKPPSIEKQMQMPDLNNFEFLGNEANMMFTPGHSGDNERSAPSSGSGNGFLSMEAEVQLPSGRKRHSSRHSGANLASVAEDKIWDIPEPDFKFRRFSENGFLHENETLVETGPTPTQHPPADRDQPMDKITDTIRMHLKTHFETPGASQVESLDQLASGANRKKAAQLFYQTLVLATHDHLKVQQTVAFGEILIFKGPKM